MARGPALSACHHMAPGAGWGDDATGLGSLLEGDLGHSRTYICGVMPLPTPGYLVAVPPSGLRDTQEWQQFLFSATQPFR